VHCTGCRRREHLGHTATWPPSGMPDAHNEAPAENRNGDVEAARGHDDEAASARAGGDRTARMSEEVKQQDGRAQRQVGLPC